MMRTHRGFTLVELLVVLVIMTIVTGGIYKLLNGTQRLSRAQTERIDLQSNVRTAAIVIPGELKGINTVVGAASQTQVDILAKSATSITYRSMWGLGFVCAGSTVNQLRLSNWTGTRLLPTPPRDSVYVFNDGADPTRGTDDTWDSRRVTNAVAENTCPAAAPTTTVTIDALGAVPPSGTPVRAFEVMQLGLYVADGKSWLGIRSVSAGEASMQPLLGPLQDGNGVDFQYLDANGAVTAVDANIKSVVVTIRGISGQQVSRGGGNANNGYLQDQIVSQISLRNALR